MRARGGDLTAKSISSVGGLIEYLSSGVGTFNFFRQRDWDQDKAWLPGIVFLGFGMAWVSEKVSVFIDVYLLLHRPSSLLKNVFRTFLL